MSSMLCRYVLGRSLKVAPRRDVMLCCGTRRAKKNNIIINSLSLLFRAASTEATSASVGSAPSSLDDDTQVETTADDKRHQHPELVQIPALPVVGSILVPWYSGVPRLDPAFLTRFWLAMGRQFGPFYAVGLPGNIGQGPAGMVNVLRDLHEFLKVLRVEGKYPYGVVQQQWPLIHWLWQNEYSVAGFYGRDGEWKRLRTFLQADLLSPTSAVEYLPAVLEGAAMASRKAAKAAADGSLELCAMDMFDRVMFGSSNGISDEDYETYCHAAVDGLGSVLTIKRDPWQNIAHKMGIETAQVRQCYRHLNVVQDIAGRRVDSFLQKWRDGTLEPAEQTSYLAKSAARQCKSQQHDDNDDTAVSQKELQELNILLLLAAVDTTVGKVAWNILQLALHPKIQDELHQQLTAAMSAKGASRLTADILTNSQTIPLLPALVRETHRCTPVIPMNTYKEIESSSVTVHGVTFPPGSCFMLDSLSPQMDPAVVERPMEFNPKRFYPAAVQARKNTPAALLDHAFFQGPFSQGARKCPGSRVAQWEVKAFVAQFVLDWKIEIVANNNKPHWSEIQGSFHTVNMPCFPDGLSITPRQ